MTELGSILNRPFARKDKIVGSIVWMLIIAGCAWWYYGGDAGGAAVKSAESPALTRAEIDAVLQLPDVKAIPGVRFANDQIDDHCRRAAVLDIKMASSSKVFEDGLRAAQAAMIWIIERPEEWGAWQDARTPAQRKKDWVKEWHRTPACLQWIKINFSYETETDKVIGGSFGVTWSHLGPEADKLAQLTPVGVIDASIFDGANEQAKHDIEAWCAAGGQRRAPRFCMASFVNLCRGYLYPHYAARCNALGLGL
ncbi:MAG: hypothetical protein EPO23_13710 [Xanthobacteraceae bacterium]|nr:MAG: hypothetical protein EPO23_13710 [Xanthobacteraceae bacterium]